MTSFTPPETSAPVCENVPFESASDTATNNKAEFDAFDQTPEGVNDPSRCKALLAFPDGTIFWSSKMAIDGDGPAAGPGRLSGSQLDPECGQNGHELSLLRYRSGFAERGGSFHRFAWWNVQNQHRIGTRRRGADHL